MAQTGFTPLLIYSSSTGGNTPTAGNLLNNATGSELAINIADGKLFYKDSGGSVQVIGWKTVPTTAGGTGLTSYTAGDLPYYASGTAFTKLGIGTSGYFMTSSGTAPQWTDPATISVTSISFGSTGLTPSTATKGAVTVAGLLATGYGGTGLTGFTAANNAIYSTSSSVLTAGTLPVAAGGTGLTSSGASGAFLVSNGSSWYANVAPACRAYTTGNTSCAVNTVTKIILNAKTFDTNNNFDATTNYRFTPTVAGYYQLTGAVTFFSYTATYTNLFFEKNGSATGPVGSGYSASSGGVSFTTSDVVYMNGTTDYIEMYVVQGTGTLNATNGFFSAVMVRGA